MGSGAQRRTKRLPVVEKIGFARKNPFKYQKCEVETMIRKKKLLFIKIQLSKKMTCQNDDWMKSC